MIHYSLLCGAGHAFDGWYKDSVAYEKLVGAGLVDCPHCGSTAVRRALMAPAISTARAVPPSEPKPAVPQPEQPPEPVRAGPPAAPLPAEMVALLQRLREKVEKDCDHVGRDFAVEARKMHHENRKGGGSERRGIYGDATEAEVEALKDEGIEVGRIPWVPRADG